MHRDDHGHAQFAPQPDDVLGPIADAVRARGETRERQEAAAPRDRGDSLDIKPAQKADPSRRFRRQPSR